MSAAARSTPTSTSAGNHIANNDLGVFVLQGDNSSQCVTPAPTPTAEQIVANLITKDDGLTNTVHRNRPIRQRVRRLSSRNPRRR